MNLELESEGRLPSSTKSCTFIVPGVIGKVVIFFVTTDWNCRLHRLTLAGVSVRRVSFSFRGGMPSRSHFEFLGHRSRQVHTHMVSL